MLNELHRNKGILSSRTPAPIKYCHSSIVMERIYGRHLKLADLLGEHQENRVKEISSFLTELGQVKCTNREAILVIPFATVLKNPNAPEMLSLSEELTLNWMLNNCPDILQLIETLLYTELSQGWLIHGDLKQDNILVARNETVSGNLHLYIDWECAGIGPKEWDIASLMAGLIFEYFVAHYKTKSDLESREPLYSNGLSRLMGVAQTLINNINSATSHDLSREDFIKYLIVCLVNRCIAYVEYCGSWDQLSERLCLVAKQACLNNA